MNEKLNFKITIDSKVKSNGESKIYLRIRHKGVKHDHYLDFDWPIPFFDKKLSRLKSRFSGDPMVDARNGLLNEILSRANKILVNAYLDSKTLTIEAFLDKLDVVINSDQNFYVFMTKKVQKLYDKQIIVYATYRRHRSSRNRLMEFTDNKPLPINDIDEEFVRSYDAWLRKTKKYSHNTVCGFHKDFKCYLNYAVEEKLLFENPYLGFKFSYTDGQREALNKEELLKLKKAFIEMADGDHKEILRRFLFSCVTGIRISDSLKVTSNMIRDNHLFLREHKGSSQYGKLTKIPLGKFALELIAGKEGLLFHPFSNKHINEQLKIMAAKFGIKKSLSFHCARDTFGTVFIEMGGDVKSLQMLMGHTNIKTTMIYLKMSEQRRQNLMANFDILFE